MRNINIAHHHSPPVPGGFLESDVRDSLPHYCLSYDLNNLVNLGISAGENIYRNFCQSGLGTRPKINFCCLSRQEKIFLRGRRDLFKMTVKSYQKIAVHKRAESHYRHLAKYKIHDHHFIIKTFQYFANFLFDPILAMNFAFVCISVRIIFHVQEMSSGHNKDSNCLPSITQRIIEL